MNAEDIARVNETARNIEAAAQALPSNVKLYVNRNGEMVIYDPAALTRGMVECGINRFGWGLDDAIYHVEQKTGEIVILDAITLASPIEQWDE